MAWKTGPLPKESWNWGAVVLKTQPKDVNGFYFADFQGDHALVYTTADMKNPITVKADDILMYNDNIDVPDKNIEKAKFKIL